MTKRQTKRGGAKKIKDLDPKAKAKGVKGGHRDLIEHVGLGVESVGSDFNNLMDKGVNRTLNPR